MEELGILPNTNVNNNAISSLNYTYTILALYDPFHSQFSTSINNKESIILFHEPKTHNSLNVKRNFST